MSETRIAEPVQVPDVEITESLSSTSHLSSSVERLVEVTRRLTVCNQLQSALDCRADSPVSTDVECEHDISPSDVPSELAEKVEIKPTTDSGPSSTLLSSTNLASPDRNTRQSPQCSTKKWARLLGISPEDIGDEEEFIRTATAFTAKFLWNAALDAAHLGSLESMEGPVGNTLRRSSSWKDKMSLPFFSKRYTQVKTIQQDELLKMIASGKPSYEQVHRWRKSFEALLADKYGLALFKEFLATEFSDENIEFWIACEEYKTITQPKKQFAKAQKIYEDFIATQACREINLDSVTRDQTITELATPSSHTFENAQKRIQALMERDSYGRFLRSDLFLTLLNQAKQAARELAAAARDGREGSGGIGGGPLRSGSSGGVGTDLPGVLAAAADAEAGMNSVQDLQLLGLSTSRHMLNATKNITKRSTSSLGKLSTLPSKPPIR